jgi:hypothetical protein
LREKAFALAQHIHDQTGDPADLFAIHQAACSHSFGHGNGPEARYYADRMAELGKEAGVESVVTITAPRMQLQAAHFLGEHDVAVPMMQSLMVMSDDVIRNRTFVPGDRVDPRVSAKILLSRTLWMQGKPEQATAMADELLASVASGWDHLLCYAAAFSAVPIAVWRGDLATARKHTLTVRTRAAERRLDFWADWGSSYSLALDFLTGTVEDPPLDLAPQTHMQVDMLATMSERLITPLAIQRVETGLVGWCASEVVRGETERALASGELSFVEAQAEFLRSLSLARRQGVIGWQLRTAISLARLWKHKQRETDAVALLSDILGQFHEGLQDTDILRAHALLKDLS